MGGNEHGGALNVKGSFCDPASVQAVTYVNAEQAPKTGIAEVDPPPWRGRPQSSQTGEQPKSGIVGFDPRGRFCRGKGDGTPQEVKYANTGDPGP